MIVLLAPQPRLPGVGGVHRLERHLIVAQETVQALQLPFGAHRFRKAEARASSQRTTDPLQSCAAPRIAQHRPTKFQPDVFEPHRCL
jgi:hypothetical protein